MKIDPIIDKTPWVLFGQNGCTIHQDCLTCPLPACRYDRQDWIGKALRKERDGRIAAIAKHASIPIIAARFKVSERTVYRALRKKGEPI